MKAQAALEYMIIVAIVFTFIIPIWSHLATVNESSQQSLSISQAQNAARKITSAADLVWAQGPPAMLTIDVYIPEGVASARMQNTSVIFTLYFGAGSTTDVASTSIGPLNGSLPTNEGLYKFVVRANTTFVNVTY
ncbi:MAG: hypothetical protein HY369_04855 [Candidatus Aenigmarchaeota archaeon]|nr:hypothetical protein [Candidatus Aenigmarchaeota archaeon]